jgi:transcription elongation factor Elf1
MNEPIHISLKLECPQCGSDQLVAETGCDELEDDEMITCRSCNVQVGVWRAVRQQALEAAEEGQ